MTNEVKIAILAARRNLLITRGAEKNKGIINKLNRQIRKYEKEN